MSTRPVGRAAIYVKEAAGYPDGENSKSATARSSASTTTSKSSTATTTVSA